MRRHALAILILLAAGATVGLRPAQAQIASYVDASGRRVYTNHRPAARKSDARSRSVKARQPSPAVAPRNTDPQVVVRGGAPVPVARIPSREGERAVAGSHMGRRGSISRSQLEQIVEKRAVEHGLDPRLVRAVVKTESAWNPTAVSSKGAEGLMQLIPATAVRFDVRDVFNPAENVEGGVRYLHELLARYDGDLAKSLAAYYAGEKRIDRAGGVPRDPATRAYVRRVTGFYLAALAMQLPGSAPIHRFVNGEGRTIYTNE